MGVTGNAIADAGKAIAKGLNNFASHSANAAATANGVSMASQQASGAFNKASADNANMLGTDRLAGQYAYNSAGAQDANSFTEMMWDRAAGFNQSMFEKQMEFNAAEAQKNREWQEHMRNTAYQAARKDMEAAGLNPILAVMNGGIQTGSSGGSAATVGLPSMSSAQGAQASGGLLNGISASEGNFSGQMEYMGGMLGLLSAGLNGISSAVQAMGQSKPVEIFLNQILDQVANDTKKAASKEGNPSKFDPNNMGIPGTYENTYKEHWKGYWGRQGIIP